MDGVHIDHREDCQVAAVATRDGHVHCEGFFVGKNQDSIGLTALQLVDEFPAPFLSHFLSILGKWPLDDNMALHTPLPGSSLSLGPFCGVLPAASCSSKDFQPRQPGRRQWPRLS